MAGQNSGDSFALPLGPPYVRIAIQSPKRERQNPSHLAETAEGKLQAMEEPLPFLPSVPRLLRNVRPCPARLEARVSWLNQAAAFLWTGLDFLLFSWGYSFLRLSLRNRRDSFLVNPDPPIQPEILPLPSGPQHKAFSKAKGAYESRLSEKAPQERQSRVRL